MTVIWTQEALQELKIIYEYYKISVSVKIAKSIKDKIFASTKNLSKHVRKGQLEELLTYKPEEYRYLLMGYYKIVYKIGKEKVYIMKVFDCRRNPQIISKM